MIMDRLGTVGGAADSIHAGVLVSKFAISVGVACASLANPCTRQHLSVSDTHYSVMD